MAGSRSSSNRAAEGAPGAERTSPRRGVSSRLLGQVGLDLPALAGGAPGDPGLFGPASMIWTVARERALIAVGPAALLMQLAHPLVAAGVDDHSDFRRDPFARLRATLDDTLTISFGDSEQSERAADRVRAVHRRVRGRLRSGVGSYATGTPYDAADPALALWVHATLVVSALDGYSALIRPLERGERTRYFEEAKAFAALFGAGPDVMPGDYAAFERYVRETTDSLTVGPAARALASAVLDPPLRPPLAPASALSRILTAGFLAPSMRAQYGLGFDRAGRMTFRSVTAATRRSVRFLPAAVRYWPHARTAMARMGAATGGAAHPLRRSGPADDGRRALGKEG